MNKVRKKADELVDLYNSEYVDRPNTVIDLMILLARSKDKWFGLGKHLNRTEIEYIQEVIIMVIEKKHVPRRVG